MEVVTITENKKQLLDLLLLGDEQEDMIDKYLPLCDLHVLYVGGSPASLCAVTREADGVIEIKNLATEPREQKKGYGSYLLDYVSKKYQGQGRLLQLGTGDVPWILRFYGSCGFQYDHSIPRFFTDNYREAMFEDGHQLIDMIYLSKPLQALVF